MNQKMFSFCESLFKKCSYGIPRITFELFILNFNGLRECLGGIRLCYFSVGHLGNLH